MDPFSTRREGIGDECLPFAVNVKLNLSTDRFLLHLKKRELTSVRVNFGLCLSHFAHHYSSLMGDKLLLNFGVKFQR